MISRANRFHGYNSLRNVYRHGVTARGPLFAVKALPNPNRKSYRLAVVVSRKVNKSAVARNRMRRRLYELARDLQDQIGQPHDIVITVFHDSLIEASTKDLRSQLKKQLKETAVIKLNSRG
jgi:ribonuclease P protein component